MYEVEIRKSAIKELSKLPSKEGLRLAKELYRLSENPRPIGSIKLRGTKNEYRLRVGDYRALYLIEDHIIRVEVFKIGHRKDVYK